MHESAAAVKKEMGATQARAHQGFLFGDGPADASIAA